MIRFILKIGWHAEILTERLSKHGLGLIIKALLKIMKLICISVIEAYLFIKYIILHLNPTPLEDNPANPIVSITSFPARINTLWLVILSLFYQTYKPAKILLVLTKEEFPQGKKSLPKSLLRLEKSGVSISFQDFNIKPHNKYYHALSTIRDRDIITVDDDLFYWPNTIENLYILKAKHPDCICSNKTLLISNENGNIHYKIPEPFSSGHALMAQGVGGVLYPPEFRTKEMFNIEKIKKMCLNNDDNWLKVQEILADIKVVTGNIYPHPLFILKSQEISLWHKNIGSGSITVTKKLFEHYNIKL